jgi:flagellar export protein FliJ
MSEDPERLERILSYRRAEEESARQQEGAAKRRLHGARARMRQLREQKRMCRQCVGADIGDAKQLLDAQHCAARLSRQIGQQEEALEKAREALARARRSLAEAGRRRLAVERLVHARRLELHERKRTAAQTELDEGGRLRLLLEGD